VEEKQNCIDIKQNTVQTQYGIRSLLLDFSGGIYEEDFTVSIQDRASSCNFLEARLLGNNLSEASPQISTKNYSRFIERFKIGRPISPIQHVSSHSGMLKLQGRSNSSQQLHDTSTSLSALNSLIPNASICLSASTSWHFMQSQLTARKSACQTYESGSSQTKWTSITATS
jgi:hypothetical protein